MSALLAVGALATPILRSERDRERGHAPEAATDLAAGANDGDPTSSGEVASGPETLLDPALVGPTLVPEPATLVLVSAGIAGLAFSGRRRKRA